MKALSLASLAERIIILEGIPRVLLALCAGALSALALAPYHFFPILFITFPVLVWLLDGAVEPADSRGVFALFRRLYPAFKVGWLFGFGYFLAGLWWIGSAFLVDAETFIYLLPVAVVALPAGLALFWGAATALSYPLWKDGWLRIWALSSSLTLAEYLRGTLFTGFPWNTLGYAFMPTPLLMQTAALIGLYGITFFTLLMVTSLAVLGNNHSSTAQAAPKRGYKNYLPLCFIVLLMAAHGGYGFIILSHASNQVADNVTLRIVQPAISQKEKWNTDNEAEIMQRYIDLSKANTGPETASLKSITHLIWPESAFPFILTERRDQLDAIAQMLSDNTRLITGAMRLERATVEGEHHRIFNALYVLNGDGEIVAARDKTHLVPFGEYLPFQQTMENLGFKQLTNVAGGFTAGNQRQTIALDYSPPFLSLICYEIIFPGQLQIPKNKNKNPPQWIVNLTNDAWYGMTAGPYQHAHQAQVRAVEEGLPVVRAANSGISMVVDANGRIRESLALGNKGVLDAKLPVAGPTTLFSRYGNGPIVLSICVLFLTLICIRLKNTYKL